MCIRDRALQIRVEPAVAHRLTLRLQALAEPEVPGLDEIGLETARGEVAECRQLAVPTGRRRDVARAGHSDPGQRNCWISRRRNGLKTLLAVTSRRARRPSRLIATVKRSGCAVGCTSKRSNILNSAQGPSKVSGSPGTTTLT